MGLHAIGVWPVCQIEFYLPGCSDMLSSPSTQTSILFHPLLFYSSFKRGEVLFRKPCSDRDIYLTANTLHPSKKNEAKEQLLLEE